MNCVTNFMPYERTRDWARHDSSRVVNPPTHHSLIRQLIDGAGTENHANIRRQEFKRRSEEMRWSSFWLRVSSFQRHPDQL